MKNPRLKSVIVYLAIVAVGVAVGSVMGGVYGNLRASAEADDQMEQVREFLAMQAPGIRRGITFPDIVLQEDYGSEGRAVGDLLPGGGLVLYVSPGCPQCERAMVNLAMAQETLGDAMSPLLIIVEGDAQEIAGSLAPLGLHAKVYADVTSAMANEYGIRIFPCYFRLDPDLRITSYGPLVQDTDDVIALAER
jgi:hypothetical protein